MNDKQKSSLLGQLRTDVTLFWNSYIPDRQTARQLRILSGGILVERKGYYLPIVFRLRNSILKLGNTSLDWAIPPRKYGRRGIKPKHGNCSPKSPN